MMRWLGLFLLVTACPAFAATVPNGGFEQANADGAASPAYWTTDQWGSVVATFTWTNDGHSGRGARVDVSASGTEGDAKWWGTDFAADGSAKTYVISDWYRASVPTDLLIWVRFADGTESYQAVATLAASATWTQALELTTIPEGAQRLRVLHVISQVGHLEIDDVTCEGKDGTVLPSKFKATVSFTFDDGWLSAYNMLIPRLDKKGWKSTNFIITTYPDKPGYQSDYILSKQVKSLIERCHEVASHTLTHPDLATLTTAEWTAEITEPIPTLKNWGSDAFGIAPPYGSYTPEILAAMAKLYPYMRTLHPDVNQPPYNAHELNGHVLTNTSNDAELEELLTRAEQIDGGWIILVFHRAAPDAPTDAHVRPEQFQGFLDLIEKHGAKVETVGEHLGYFKCTELPSQPTLVVGDKSLDPPVPATEVAQTPTTEPDVQPPSGCQAGTQPQTPWLLLLVVLGLAVRRRQLNVRPG
jgi:MYXO-CTERM domain-containing protein